MTDVLIIRKWTGRYDCSDLCKACQSGRIGVEKEYEGTGQMAESSRIGQLSPGFLWK